MDSVGFPPGFLWGAATAAYQIEGAATEDGRTESIWDAFARRPGAVAGGEDGSVACDHYHRWPEDLDLLRRLGLGSYRFSVSWDRVRPDGGAPNRPGLDFYSRLVDGLLERGIVPWLTLYHWDLPQAIEERGGWRDRDTVERFVEYAGSVHDALGDRVQHWTTLNEPWCAAFLGHASGHHAPGLRDGRAALTAAHHLLLAHGRAVQELRARDSGLRLGLSLNFTDTRPARPGRPGDVDAARRVDGLANRFFAEAVFRGSYPSDVLEDVAAHWPEDAVRAGDLATISTPVDVLGVNYYAGEAVTAGPREAAVGSSPHVGSEFVRTVPRGLPVTDMGWEILPGALTELLVRLQEQYTGPAGTALYVTENGAAFPDVPDAEGFVDDVDRIAYLDAHVRAVAEAMRRGADVRGYFAWSLLDNFEWAFGYGRRFGLVRVDYGSQRRTPKASAAWLAELARTGELPAR